MIGNVTIIFIPKNPPISENPDLNNIKFKFLPYIGKEISYYSTGYLYNYRCCDKGIIISRFINDFQ
jgi:hypothetical protein